MMTLENGDFLQSFLAMYRGILALRERQLNLFGPYQLYTPAVTLARAIQCGPLRGRQGPVAGESMGIECEQAFRTGR